MSNKILCLTRYGELGASSRLRFYQYINDESFSGLDIKVSPFFKDDYLERLYSGKSVNYFSLIHSYISRVIVLLSIRNYSLVWVEKEMLPLMPPIFERLCDFLNIKYVVDYDDAVFHNYDMSNNRIVRFFLGKKIDKVMKLSSCVVSGNGYISERARQAGASKIVEVPTVIDMSRYETVPKFNDKLVIGWMGTPSTQKYIENISEQLVVICSKYNAVIRLVGASEIVKDSFPEGTVEVVDWSENTEVSIINTFDIGIMPLKDGPWEKGKCGYKLIQYLGCSVPAVVSDVGVNREIIEVSQGGLLVGESNDWVSTIGQLIHDNEKLLLHGINGRKAVYKYYSLQSQSQRLSHTLKELF